MTQLPPVPSRLRTLGQLLRLPNVFTAMADVLFGWLAAASIAETDSAPSWVGLLVLLGASSSLYLAGMVLNDVFDAAEDARDRPFRPIPSGRIRRRTAACLGGALLAAGILLGVFAGPWSARFAVPLAVLVLIYDAWLKRTPMGPVGMGACRFLNVLLGFSVAQAAPPGWMLASAAAVGMYIAGVTQFARTEAVMSRKGALLAGALLLTAGANLSFALPVLHPGAADRVAPFMLLFAIWLTVVLGPAAAAIHRPGPSPVQRAVKQAILGLIGLDAIMAFAVAGPAGLLLLFLLVPALVLGKWLYST